MKMTVKSSTSGASVQRSAQPARLSGAEQSRLERITVSSEGRRVDAQIIVPATVRHAVPLIVQHGISRDAEAMVRHFTPEAERTGRIIIVPFFAEKIWPVFQRPTRRARPDRALLALLDALALQYPGFDAAVDFFGYSGGAQLAHRAAMLYPHRFAELHLGSAGWYCLPDLDVPHPYGLAPSQWGSVNWQHCKLEMLPAFLNRRITVYSGDLDTQRDDALRKNALVDSTQGSHRVERAETFVRVVNQAAVERGLPPPARFVTLAGCGHSFNDCCELAGLSQRVASVTPASPNGVCSG